MCPWSRLVYSIVGVESDTRKQGRNTNQRERRIVFYQHAYDYPGVVR